MNYSLAKQLKKSGFPQKGAFGHQLFASGGRGATVEQCNKYPDLVAYAPSLEELIEACGDKFATLSYAPEKQTIWVAAARYLIIGKVMTHDGSTPTEAVAKLWLALNPKKPV